MSESRQQEGYQLTPEEEQMVLDIYFADEDEETILARLDELPEHIRLAGQKLIQTMFSESE